MLMMMTTILLPGGGGGGGGGINVSASVSLESAIEEERRLLAELRIKLGSKP